MFAVVLTALLLLVLFFALRRRSKPRPNNAPPLVKEADYFGLLCTKNVMRDTLTTVPELVKQYGNSFSFYSAVFGTYVTCITGPQSASFFYAQDDSILDFASGVDALLRGIIGERVRPLTPSYHRWKNAHLLSAFKVSREVDSSIVKEEVDSMCKSIASAGKADLLHSVEHLIASINVRCFLGEDAPQFKSLVFELLTELERNGLHFVTLFLPWLPFGPPVRARRIRERLQKEIGRIIETRRKNGIERDDYLGKWMARTVPESEADAGKHFDVAELTGEMIKIFFAAHVNTMISLTWSIARTAERPDVIKLLVERGDPAADAIVLDAQRLAMIPTLFRKAAIPVEYEGRTIPAGDMVVVFPVLDAYNTAHFPNPSEFNPERWLLPLDSRPPSVSIFGGGVHMCKGQTFAQLVLRTALGEVFRHYKVSVAGALPEIAWEKQRHPRTPIMVKMERKTL